MMFELALSSWAYRTDTVFWPGRCAGLLMRQRMMPVNEKNSLKSLCAQDISVRKFGLIDFFFPNTQLFTFSL
jgi:hypothetical protein